MRGPERYGPEDADAHPDLLGFHGRPCGGKPAPLGGRRGAGQRPALHRHLALSGPNKAEEALEGVRRAVAVEQNYTGQLARLLRM